MLRLLNVRVHRELADEAEEQRVAVGRCLRHDRGADAAARSGAVIHDELLAEPVSEPLSRRPRHEIVAATGRSRDDDPYRLDGVGLRRGAADGERPGKPRDACCNAALPVHGDVLLVRYSGFR
jgi:hypothetical protein